MCSVLRCVQLSATPETVARQAPLSMEFSQHEYWSGLPFPTPGDLPDPGIKPTSLMSPALAGKFYTTEPPGKPFPSPGDLPHPGIEPTSLMSPALAGGFFASSASCRIQTQPQNCWIKIHIYTSFPGHYLAQ